MTTLKHLVHVREKVRQPALQIVRLDAPYPCRAGRMRRAHAAFDGASESRAIKWIC